jgi:hypothetical protein
MDSGFDAAHRPGVTVMGAANTLSRKRERGDLQKRPFILRSRDGSREVERKVAL